jgi:glycosyltransferase involved in cell wall biosynthesis
MSLTAAYAQQLKDRHDVRLFALVSDIRGGEAAVPVTDFVPRQLLGVRRELLMPAFIPAMTAAVCRFKPELIHHHVAVWSRPAAGAARQLRVPLVTTVQGPDLEALRAEPATVAARRRCRNVLAAAEQSSRILAGSHYLAVRAAALGLDAGKIEVHYQGVDTGFYAPGARNADSTPIVLFVGALNTRNGIRDLVDASRAVWRKARHRLVIIGDGPLREPVQEQASSHPHIDFLGWTDQAAIRDRMQQAHVLVAPGHEAGGAGDAPGLVLLQAQACGTPVLAYRSGGVAEMLEEQTTGLLAAESDFRQLCDGLLQMLRLGGSGYLSMRQAARRYVLEHRSLARSSEQLDDHYRQLHALA